MCKGKDASETHCINRSITVVDPEVKINIYLSLIHSPLSPDLSDVLQVSE